MASAAAAAALAAGTLAAWNWKERRSKLPDAFVLRLDAGLDATVTSSQGTLTNEEAALATTHAARDKRCRGLVLKVRSEESPNVGSATVGRLARAQELRDAIVQFRNESSRCNEKNHLETEGKMDRSWNRPTLAFAEHWGGFGANGTLSYYLASACEKIFVQPGGTVALLGMSQPRWYAREMLERHGIRPRVIAKGLYKSAGDVFGKRRSGKHIRKAAKELTESLQRQVEMGIAMGRSWSVERYRATMKEGEIMDGSRAIRAGLVDGEMYWDQVEDLLPSHSKRKGKLPQLGAMEYLDALKRETRYKTKSKVALVFLNGAVVLGRGRDDGFTAGSDGVCAALKAAGEDASVGAVVLRLDSPGGSPSGSIAIEREVYHIMKKGKPVIASMADVAASGAYLVAAACSHITAQPGSITGSIGTLAAKFDVRNLLRRHGVNVELALGGPNAEMFSPYTGWTRSQAKIAAVAVESAYIDFCDRVSRGRNMSAKQVSRVAQGRVFTGLDAVPAGLVDSLGGLQHAVEVARIQAGMAPEPSIVVFAPATRPSLEAILSMLQRRRSLSLLSMNLRWMSIPWNFVPGLLVLAELLEQEPIQHVDLNLLFARYPI